MTNTNNYLLQLISFAASCCGAATCSMVCSACGKCGNRYDDPIPSKFLSQNSHKLTRIKKCCYPCRLRPPPPRQLDIIVDYAHPLGHRKAAASDARLRQDRLSQRTMLRMASRPPNQFRPRSLSPRLCRSPLRCRLLQESSSLPSEWFLGAQGHCLDRLYRLVVPDSRRILSSMG